MSTLTRSKRKELQEQEELRKFKEGDRVVVKHGKTGTVKFTGETQFAQGKWVGIELDDPDGNNDGRVNGVTYFDAEADHGIFLPPHKVSHEKTEENSGIYRTLAKTAVGENQESGAAAPAEPSTTSSKQPSASLSESTFEVHTSQTGAHDSTGFSKNNIQASFTNTTSDAEVHTPQMGTHNATGTSEDNIQTSSTNTISEAVEEGVSVESEFQPASDASKQGHGKKTKTTDRVPKQEDDRIGGGADSDRSVGDKQTKQGKSSLEKRSSKLEEIKRRKELSRQKLTSLLPEASSDSRRSSGSKEKPSTVRGGRSSLPVPRRSTQQRRSQEDRKSIDNAELGSANNTRRKSNWPSSKHVTEEDIVPEDVSESEEEELQFAHEQTDKSHSSTETGNGRSKESVKKIHALLSEKLRAETTDQSIHFEESEKAKLRDAFKEIFGGDITPPSSLKQSRDRRDASDAALRSPPKKQVAEQAQLQASMSTLKRQISDLKEQVREKAQQVKVLEADKEELSIDKDIVEEEKVEQEQLCHAWRVKCEKVQEELRTLREAQIEPQTKSTTSKQKVLQQNWQLREALSKLRNIYHVDVGRLRRELNDSQKEATRSAILAEESEKQAEEIRSLRAENFELLEQLDTATAYEEMIEDLTEKNLTLSDRLEELKLTRDDFEELQQIYEQLEEHYVENERLLKMEVSKQQQVIDEYERRVDQLCKAVQRSRQLNDKLKKASQGLLEEPNNAHRRGSKNDSRYNALVAQLRNAVDQRDWISGIATQQFQNLKYCQTGVRLMQTAAYTFCMMLPVKVLERFWNFDQHYFNPYSHVGVDSSADATCAMFTSLILSVEQILGGLDFMVSRCYEFVASVIHTYDSFSELSTSGSGFDSDVFESSLEKYQSLPELVGVAMQLVKTASLFRLLRAALLTGQGSVTRLCHTVPKCMEQIEECEQLVEQLIEKKIETLPSCTREVDSLFRAACDVQTSYTNHMESEAHSTLVRGIINLVPSDPDMVKVLMRSSTRQKQEGREIVSVFTVLQLRFWQHVNLLVKGYMCFYRIVASITNDDRQFDEESKQQGSNNRFHELKDILRGYLTNAYNATLSIYSEAKRLADSCHSVVATPNATASHEANRFWTLRCTTTPSLVGSSTEMYLPANMFELVQRAQNLLWQHHLGRSVSASRNECHQAIPGYWCSYVGASENDLGLSGFSAANIKSLSHVLTWQGNTPTDDQQECLPVSLVLSASEDDLRKTSEVLKEMDFHSSNFKRVSVECVPSLSLEYSELTLDVRQQELVPFLKPFLDVQSRLDSSTEMVEDLESARSLHAETIQELEEKEKSLQEAESRIKVMEGRLQEGINQEHSRAKKEENIRQLRQDLEQQRIEYENKLEVLESLREDTKRTAHGADDVNDSSNQQASSRLNIFGELRLLIERQKEQIAWWKSMHVESTLRFLPDLPSLRFVNPRRTKSKSEQDTLAVTPLESVKKISGAYRLLRANVKVSTCEKDWRSLEGCAASYQQKISKLEKQYSTAKFVGSARRAPGRVASSTLISSAPAESSKSVSVGRIHQELLSI